MTIHELIDRLTAVDDLDQDIYILDSKAAMLRPVTDVTILDKGNFVAVESEYMELMVDDIDCVKINPKRKFCVGTEVPCSERFFPRAVKRRG